MPLSESGNRLKSESFLQVMKLFADDLLFYLLNVPVSLYFCM